MEQRLCTERVTSGDARRLFASTSLEKQWLHLALNRPHLFLPGRTSAQIGPTAAQSVGLWFQDQPLPWRLGTMHRVLQTSTRKGLISPSHIFFSFADIIF